MNLLHRSDLRRNEVPFASGFGPIWRLLEEFDTTEPVANGVPQDYIEGVVTDFIAGGGVQGLVDRADALLVEADPMPVSGVRWLGGLAMEARWS